MKIIDTTEQRWSEMSKGTHEENQKQKMLWFDNDGMGPAVHDWTVRLFTEDAAARKEAGEGVHILNIGIEYSRIGGPYMTVETAERVRDALTAAIDLAKGR